MNLSRFFTLDELTFSNTAKAEGINNQPTATEIDSLRALCTAVLDPLREALGKPIKVTSGYRGPALNRRVKGAAKSQHLSGEAADIQSPGTAVLDVFKQVIRLGLPFDQIIYEVNGTSKWVHVSHSRSANAGEILLGKFDANGKVTYPRLTAEQALALTEPTTRSAGPAVEPGYEEMADEPPRAARKARSVKTAEPAPKPKPAAKAPAAKKVAAKVTTNAATKKSPAKKAPAKKASTTPAAAPEKAEPRKPAARRVAAKKVPAKKAPTQTVAAKKAAVKLVAAKKVAAKKVAAKQAPAKTTPAKKVAAKSLPVKKAAAKKVAAKKAPLKKAAAKKTG